MVPGAFEFWRAKWPEFFRWQLIAGGIGLSLQSVSAVLDKTQSFATSMTHALIMQTFIVPLVSVMYWGIVPVDALAASLQETEEAIERQRRRMLRVLPIWAGWLPVGGALGILLETVGWIPR